MATIATVSAAATIAGATHILVFPYPAQGHMPALLDLTNQLALRGLKITILATPKNLPALTPLLSAHPNSIQTLVFPFPHHPKLPLGVENIKDIGNSGNAPMIAALSRLEDQVLEWFQTHPYPPQAIISDFFLGFTQNWAAHLNIPRLAFFSVSAFLTLILNDLMLRLDELFGDPDYIVEFSDLPMSPFFVKDQLPSIFKKFKKGDPDWEIVKEGMIVNSRSWGYVYNSFHELEGVYLDHIRNKLVNGRVYCVGPLPTTERVNPDSVTRCEVLKWLDTCPDGSVLYVCFGSQKLLSKSQVQAIALGLEQSKTRFIWVVKSDNREHLPNDFDKRVSGTGVVLSGWAPQVEILNHKAVGRFVSHCGWNSILESLMAGVMLLCWPMEADQFINAKLMVEHLGLAVQLCEGEHTVPDSEKMAQIIGETVGEDVPEKARVKAMRYKALEAMKDAGSSSISLDVLVTDLRQIPVPKRCIDTSLVS